MTIDLTEEEIRALLLVSALGWDHLCGNSCGTDDENNADLHTKDARRKLCDAVKIPYSRYYLD
jgi:hypothetical protein